MDSPGGRRDSDEPLPELLRSWRRRTSPRAIPGTASARRRADGLTQREVARLAGVSERWYGSLERGKKADYSTDFLDRLSSVLELSRAERHALYLGAVGRPPPAAAPEAETEVGVDEALQEFLDNQAPDPAFVADLAWNLVGYNEMLLDWFPWAAHQANLMRWAFLGPEARDQLVNWEQDWVRPYLGQIRYERAQHPRHDALRRLERDILAGSPEARRLWGSPEMVEHIDGDIRRLRLPVHRGHEVVVRILALRPMRSDRLRVVVLMEQGRGPRSV